MYRYGIIIAIILLVIGLQGVKSGYCRDFTNNQIADAIYKAEGGSKTSHPYGILAHYKHTTPRQACLNTIASAKRRYAKSNQRIDFVTFLSKTYCPVGCDNDNGTNKYWVKNVKFYLRKEAI